MRITYIAAATCVHGHKWITHFAKSHDVMLLCEENPKSLSLYADAPEVRIRPILPRAYPLRRVFRRHHDLWRLKSAIKAHRTEIVHSMYAVPYSFWGHDLGFENHIVTTRGSDLLVDYKKMQEPSGAPWERITKYLLRRTLESTLRSARYVTSTSRRQQDTIRHLVGSERLVLARTGVDAEEFLKVYEGLERTPGTKKLIFSNRAMLPVQDIELIIDAFVLLRKNTPLPAGLVTINYPPDQPYHSLIMNKIAGSPFKDDITVLGPRTKHELIQLYRDADLVVMVPKSDGTPVSGVEALLARKPLIMGPLDYDKDLFNPETVWTLKTRSPVELAEKMRLVLALPEPAIQLKAATGFLAAREHADLKKEIKKVERLYSSLA